MNAKLIIGKKKYAALVQRIEELEKLTDILRHSEAIMAFKTPSGPIMFRNQAEDTNSGK